MTKTVGELAVAIGAELEGDPDFEVRGVAAPERAGARDLIYVEGTKHAERAAASAAVCVIAGEGVTFGGKTGNSYPPLRSDRPIFRSTTFSGMSLLLSQQGEQPRINELAVFEEVLAQEAFLLKAALFEDTGRRWVV